MSLFKHGVIRTFNHLLFDTQGKTMYFIIVVWDSILFYFFIFHCESVRKFPEQ